MKKKASDKSNLEIEAAFAKKPKKASKAALKEEDPRVQVRMYNTGFGDCFLLRFPCEGGIRKVLIDCGKHNLSTCEPSIKVVVAQVLKDLEAGEANGPRVDVLIMTHRHQDHVSGFAFPGWENVTVGEVWMPWTENPEDSIARRICDMQSKRAFALQEDILPHLDFKDENQRTYLLGYAGNNMKNEKAMELLHNGFKGKPLRRFLPVSDESQTDSTAACSRSAMSRALLPTADEFKNDNRSVKTPHLPGVEVFVLGPSRDEDVIRDMDPPSGEYYEMALRDNVADAIYRKRATLAEGSVTAEPPGTPKSTSPAASSDSAKPSSRSPFGTRWQLKDAKEYADWYRQHSKLDPSRACNPFAGFRDKKNKDTWPNWAPYIGRVADDPESELAATLESSVNGTSLVLIFRIGCATLLFPGDAQWGSWNAILADPQWQRLLKSVSFYKVGHHGSENATPRTFIEKYLPKSAKAMIPTDEIRKWPTIPKAAILQGLVDREVKFVRNDRSSNPDPSCFRRFEIDGVTQYVDLDISC